MTATIGTLSEFIPEKETISAYLERVELFFTANGIGEEKQPPVLLTAIGRETYALLRNLLAPDKPSAKTFAQLKVVLQRHFDPKPLVIAERFCFHRRCQQVGESIAEYIAELRRLATNCEFGEYLEQALRDRLVCGLKHEPTQKRLLSESSLSLAKAIEIAQSVEAAEKNTLKLKGGATGEVLRISPRRNRKPEKKEVCYRCGNKGHQPGECRYKDAKCHKCHKVGHLAKVCRSRNTSTDKQGGDTKWIESSVTGTQEREELPLYTISDKVNKPFLVELQVKGNVITFEVDTGAAVSIMAEENFRYHFPSDLISKSTLQLKTYTKDKLPVIGEVKVPVSYNNQRGEFMLYIVKGKGPNLLGRNWLEYLTLDWKALAASVNYVSTNQLERLLHEYADVLCDKLGTLNSMKAKLHVQPNAVPKFHKARPVPFSMKDAIGQEIDRLESEGILEKVKHSEWAAPVVAVPKGNGQLRLCGDYKVTVNPVLSVEKYPLPKPEDLMSNLAGGLRFSKLDLSQAYLQIVLDQESRKYVTIATHKGLYQYTRVPFGIASAPALFQRNMDTILQGIPNTICYLDDILVTGKSPEAHLANLEKVLKRLRQHGLRVRPSKCAFMQESVEYLGHKIDSRGVHTTTSKVDAIQKAPIPRNAQQLRSFLGLLHYYGKFIPNLSIMLHPLNRLLQASTEWKWDEQCDKAFKEAKEKLVSAPILAHYDPSKKLKLAADASAYGIGAVLSHVVANGCERPIAYASRTLSKAEQHYAQIDKEAMALIFGVQRFHQYLYGRKFVLVTDHKPLLSIFGPKNAIPPLAAARLQRWAVLLSAYSYDVEFRRTERHANADSLSRLPLKSPCSDIVQDEATIFSLCQVEYLPVTAEEIQKASRNDLILSKVFRYTKSGWPKQVEDELKPYWNHHKELVIEGGCLMLGIRVVIPHKLQRRVLEELHRDHPGIVRMKSVARSYCWWSHMDQDIEALVQACQPCQLTRNTLSAAPLHPWLWPSKPWVRIHVDFAGPFQKKMFMLVVDAHSKWPEIVEMPSTTASKTIEELRKLFSAYGLPEQVVTDNGPQFIADEFTVFLKQNGIKHLKCSPYHPSSNGAVERLVQSFKKSLRASESDGRTVSHRLSSFLFTYRSTPHASTNTTPSELFLKRLLRTRLDLLHPNVETAVCLSQAKQKASTTVM